MKIVRIEHPDTGLGLFRHVVTLSTKLDSKFDKEFDELLSRHGSFPFPFMEGLELRKDSKRWFCAFNSIEQLQKWITKEELLSITNNWGYRVLFLEVEEFQQATFQTIFTKESIIHSTDITELFNK